MKKNIEIAITIGLIGLSLLIISGLIAGIVDFRLRDTSNLSLYAIVGFTLATICSYVFPKINTVVVQEASIIPGKSVMIKKYLRDPGSMFLYITLGYIGFLFCVQSTSFHFDAKWGVGTFFIFLYLQGLLTPFLGIKRV